MVTFPHEFVGGYNIIVFGKAKYCLIGYLSDHHLTSGTLLFALEEMTWNFLKKKNPPMTNLYKTEAHYTI